MSMSKRNTRLELQSRQVTGNQAEGAGVYARLLVDKSLQATFDVRYFGYDVERKRYRETRKGLAFSRAQLAVLRDALAGLDAEAERRGLQ